MDMTALNTVEKLALALPERQRAALAVRMLDSLPALLLEEDQGLAEAQKRDDELDRFPVLGLSLEEFDNKICGRRVQ
jgi:ABC-type thiamine transport system ATPase subunit